MCSTGQCDTYESGGYSGPQTPFEAAPRGLERHGTGLIRAYALKGHFLYNPPTSNYWGGNLLGNQGKGPTHLSGYRCSSWDGAGIIISPFELPSPRPRATSVIIIRFKVLFTTPLDLMLVDDYA